MGKKVLITGGSGMIGSHITEKLLAQGYVVNHLSRSPNKVQRVKSHYWDPESGQFDEQALKDVDYIINLAGAGIADKRWSPKRKRELLESRTKSTSFLRNQLKTGNHQVKAIISASGSGYYGYDNGGLWQKESSRFGDDFIATVVKSWEEEARAYEELGIRVVILRFGMVLSLKGGALPRITQPIKYGVGAALGPGDQWISWVHIDDVAGVIGFALNEERISGIYNVASPNPVTNKEFTKRAAHALGRPLFLPNVPAFALRLVFGELSATVLGSCRLSSEKIINSGYRYQYETVDEAFNKILK